MRLLFSLLILAAPSVALAELPVAAVATRPVPAQPADPAASVVFVEHNNAAGTGTVVASESGKSLVLTCAHVVEHAGGTITVTTKTGTRHAATYLGGSAVRTIGPSLIDVDGPDLAILSVDADLPAVTIADEQPAVGAPVQLWGFGGRPFGAKPAHKTGFWDRDPPWLKPAVAYTIRTISGDSGAGVFNERGELVAVHHGADGRRGYATPLSTLRGWLRERVAKFFPRLAARLVARGLAKAIAALSPKLPEAAPPPKKVEPKNEAPTSGPTRANGYVLRRHWDGVRWHQWWEYEGVPAPKSVAPDCPPGQP